MFQDSVDFTPVPDDVPMPLGAYVAVAIRNEVGYVSGQFPIRSGEVVLPGRLGAELSVVQGKEAARIAALNVLGQIKRSVGGDLSRVRLARVDGFIAAAPGFADLPSVLDGASETFVAHLGERGMHARGVFPVTCLPRNAAIELMTVFHLVRHDAAADQRAT